MIDEMLESNPEFGRTCKVCKGPRSDGCGCDESGQVEPVVTRHDRVLPVAIWPGKKPNPYNPWYSVTKNRKAAATVLWFGFGRKMMDAV
jgi:hypothetical protein